jgi:hypothetical protein
MQVTEVFGGQELLSRPPAMSPVLAELLSELVAVPQRFTMLVINPIDCEGHSMIKFLNAKNVHPGKIHHQLVEVYGEGVMNEGMRVSGVIYLRGERQMCTEKCDLDTPLSSLRI